MTRDISNIAGRLRSAVIARANFDQVFGKLLEELGVRTAKDKALVTAMVRELADPARWTSRLIETAITEADAQELLRRVPNKPGDEIRVVEARTSTVSQLS